MFENTLCVTHCCAQKNTAEGLLPVYERYQSDRVQTFLSRTSLMGVNTRILSSKFGLLAPDDMIPSYDQLLLPAHLPTFVPLIAGQLEQVHDEAVTFFAPFNPDADVKTYQQSLVIASHIVGKSFTVIPINKLLC